jgi:hypothetical protein
VPEANVEVSAIIAIKITPPKSLAVEKSPDIVRFSLLFSLEGLGVCGIDDPICPI